MAEGRQSRRVRNHRAETQRRNELAQQRGFTSRAAERGAKKRNDYSSAGLQDHAEYISARRAAQAWSDRNSRQDVSRFNPSWSVKRTLAYIRAYGVSWTDGVPSRRGPRQHEAFVHRLADYLTDYYSDRYPPYDRESEYWSNY